MPSSWTIETPANADLRADRMLCPGGIFEVEWKGLVSIKRPLYGIDGTVLDKAGSSDAIADGGGNTQLYCASNGSLRVSELKIKNNAGIHGGAIPATRGSEMTLTSVNFGSNTADGFGGAVHLDNSSLELAGSSAFTGNSAVNGGVICMVNNSTFVQRAGSREMYRFINNTSTNGGAFYVSIGSIVAGCNRVNFTSTSNFVVSFSEATYLHAYDFGISATSTFDAIFAKRVSRGTLLKAHGVRYTWTNGQHGSGTGSRHLRETTLRTVEHYSWTGQH